MTHHLLDIACTDDGFAMDNNDSECKWHQILKLMMEEKIDEPTKRTNHFQQMMEKSGFVLMMFWMLTHMDQVSSK